MWEQQTEIQNRFNLLWYKIKAFFFSLSDAESENVCWFYIIDDLNNYLIISVFGFNWPCCFQSGLCNKSSLVFRPCGTERCTWWSTRQRHSVPEWGCPTPPSPPAGRSAATECCPGTSTARHTWRRNTNMGYGLSAVRNTCFSGNNTKTVLAGNKWSKSKWTRFRTVKGHASLLQHHGWAWGTLLHVRLNIQICTACI